MSLIFLYRIPLSINNESNFLSNFFTGFVCLANTCVVGFPYSTKFKTTERTLSLLGNCLISSMVYSGNVDIVSIWSVKFIWFICMCCTLFLLCSHSRTVRKEVLLLCTIWLTCDSKSNGFLLNTSALTFERPDLYLTSKSNCAIYFYIL
jgi:hypothetical protein